VTERPKAHQSRSISLCRMCAQDRAQSGPGLPAELGSERGPAPHVRAFPDDLLPLRCAPLRATVTTSSPLKVSGVVEGSSQLSSDIKFTANTSSVPRRFEAILLTDPGTDGVRATSLVLGRRTVSQAATNSMPPPQHQIRQVTSGTSQCGGAWAHGRAFARQIMHFVPCIEASHRPRDQRALSKGLGSIAITRCLPRRTGLLRSARPKGPTSPLAKDQLEQTGYHPVLCTESFATSPPLGGTERLCAASLRAGGTLSRRRQTAWVRGIHAERTRTPDTMAAGEGVEDTARQQGRLPQRSPN